MIPNVPDSAFDEIFNEFQKYPCTPDIDSDDFRGILLNAPKVVQFGPDTKDPRFGGFARMYVCGACQFDYDYLGLGANFKAAIQLFAVNEKTHQVYPGRMQVGIKATPPRDPSIPIQNQTIGEVFAPNLTRITAIPEEEGDYLVYATLGEYKSNTVRIQLRRKRP